MRTLKKLTLLALCLSPLAAMGVVGANALEDARDNMQTEVDWNDADGSQFDQQELSR